MKNNCLGSKISTRGTVWTVSKPRELQLKIQGQVKSTERGQLQSVPCGCPEQNRILTGQSELSSLPGTPELRDDGPLTLHLQLWWGFRLLYYMGKKICQDGCKRRSRWNPWMPEQKKRKQPLYLGTANGDVNTVDVDTVASMVLPQLD